MQMSHFIKAFIQNPLGVSTIFPASTALATAMALGSEIKDRKNIVEIGVGTGALTSAMLPLMGPDHSYTGFEIDPTFYKYLEKNFTKKHSAEIKNFKHFEFRTESAEHISQFFLEQSVDVVVSSLPWSVFESDMQNSILNEIYKIMKPGGVFSFYNYMTASQFQLFKNFRANIDSKFSSLGSTHTVWASFPPAKVWVAKK